MTKYGLSIDWDYFMEWCPPKADYTFYHTHQFWHMRRSLQTPVPFREDLFDEIQTLMMKATDEGLICENHARAYRWFADCDMVLNLDYHRDDYYNYFHEDLVSCRSWVPALECDYGTRVIHCPPPKKDADTFAPFIIDPRFPSGIVENFDRVLICRSSPWTDPSHDDRFLDMNLDLGFPIEQGLEERDPSKDRALRKAAGEQLAENHFRRLREMSVVMRSGAVMVF